MTPPSNTPRASKKFVREHVWSLCIEHGHGFILDCVQEALESHLAVLQVKIDYIPSQSQEEDSR